MNVGYRKPPAGLIVSCQAAEGEVFYGLDLMKYMAQAAVAGGAIAIRALAEEIPEIKKAVDVPVIGLVKRVYADSEVYMTPTFREIDEVIASGADVIAMDVTGRRRPDGISTEELVRYARKRASGIYLMADTDGEWGADEAEKLGFDFVGTTMRGYTQATKGTEIPDLEYLARLKKRLKSAALIAEGGVWEVEQLRAVLRRDPYAVVIGTAITRPKNITERFNRVMREKKE